ncbi:MAG: hypothetical protein HY862_02010 [Chloroflexi bacterium]|nr:hypothetical protein [Chloroflexota bacterium]
MNTIVDNSQNSVVKARSFITETRSKMEQLVADFADGKLNREQFHVLYERYQSQINGVKLLLAESDPSSWTEILDGEKTQLIRRRLQAKAVGMIIYHSRTSACLETLGEISAERGRVKPLLEKLMEQIKQKTYNQNQGYPIMVVEVSTKCWIFIARGEIATIVTEFNGEPTTDQEDTLIALLRDFERANSQILKRNNTQADHLAMPFQVFVQRARKG